MGDFNLPNVVWREDGTHHICGGTSTERAFIEMFDTLGLLQWISLPTYPSSGNTLDLVLTTEPDCIGSITVEAPLPVCDHCPIVFDYIISGAPEKDTHPDLRILWRKGNYKRLNQVLSDIDWDFELAFLSSDDS